MHLEAVHLGAQLLFDKSILLFHFYPFKFMVVDNILLMQICTPAIYKGY